jgi:hypothetical protein
MSDRSQVPPAHHGKVGAAPAEPIAALLAAIQYDTDERGRLHAGMNLLVVLTSALASCVPASPMGSGAGLVQVGVRLPIGQLHQIWSVLFPLLTQPYVGCSAHTETLV